MSQPTNFPMWIHYPDDYIRAALKPLSQSALRTAPLYMPTRWSKDEIIDAVLVAFRDAVKELPPGLSCTQTRQFFSTRLGETVMVKLVYPPCPPQDVSDPPSYFAFRLPPPSNACTKAMIKAALTSLHPSRRGAIPTTFDQRATLLLDSLLQRVCMLARFSFEEVLSYVHCFKPDYLPPEPFTLGELIYYFLTLEYDADVIRQFTMCKVERRQDRTKEGRDLAAEEENAWWKAQDEAWPHPPDIMRSISIVKKYHESSNIKFGPVCSVCSRCKLTTDLLVTPVPIFSEAQHAVCDSLRLLLCRDPRFEQHFIFPAPWDRLNGLMLERKGMVIGDQGELCLNICIKCHSFLLQAKMPRHAWANNLYRGPLDRRFEKMSWLEEKACAPANTTAHVVRVFNSSQEDAPRVFYGNVCAHDANVVDLAAVLPRTPQDLNECITVVFVGPEKYKADCIKKMFYVRKPLMLEFLYYMKYVTKHPDYVNIPISEENLALYPDGDELPGASAKVIHDTETPLTAFQQETAGPDPHPAEGLVNEPGDEATIFLEKIGISDPDGQTGSASIGTAYALRNLYAKKGVAPDLVLQRGRDAIPEYYNPRLFPAMFPTLFPYGTGGFEDVTRQTSISFQEQANLYLDTIDRGCRYHHSFIFVICNIIQRRAGHLGTYFTVRDDRFDDVAKRLIKIEEKVVLSIADRMEKGVKLGKLNVAEEAVMELLKEVRTVAARVPGSFAGKLRARTEIRNYMAFFNLPTFFFTANPNAVHSPLFQIMYGDETVNLDERFPCILAYNEKARRLAHDPVAAADFFEVSFRLILEVLLGWDFSSNMSTREGGLLGHVAAWYEMSELTARGGIHGHVIIWTRGSLNPSQLHERLRQDPAFEKRVCQYFESIQWHSLPDVTERDVLVGDVRSERLVPPPDVPLDFPMGELTFVDCFENPGAFCARLEVAGYHKLSEWWMEFLKDVKTCGEKLQRHTCRAVCFKYDHKECRFQFPHEVVPESHFDRDTNSLRIRVKDAQVNWLNPFILYGCRHNHDIRTMNSGTTSRAVMYYVTDYVTKMEEKTHYIISLLSRAVIANKAGTPGVTPAAAAKSLIHKCLSQLTGRQQIHAQQAVWYVRGHSDAMSSHETIPMLSGLLICFVKTTYCSKETKPSSPLTTTVTATSLRDGDDEEDLETDISAMDPGGRQVRIIVDPETKEVKTSTQIENYYYRDAALHNVSFYEFVLRYRIDKKTTPKSGPRALKRFALVHPHPQKESHEIVEHTNFGTHPNAVPKVPVVYGTSIPRSTGDREQYSLFVLAHFKPFSPGNPLITPSQSWSDVLQAFPLGELGKRIVQNWDALYECEDEREQERLKKVSQRRKTTAALHATVVEQADLLLVDEMAEGKKPAKTPLHDFLFTTTGSLLCSGGWIQRSVADYRFGRVRSSTSACAQLPTPKLEVTPTRLNAWLKELKEQEKTFLNTPELLQRVVNDTSRVYQPSHLDLESVEAHTTLVTASEELASESPASIISRIGTAAKLNPEQRIVYEIAANAYIDLLEERRLGINQPGDPDFKRLKMFVNGPGGTGKTYAIQTFQDLMKEFRCGHRIKYTAPSGAAASLIHGVTLHSGLKIRVFKGKQKHGQYSFTLTSQQKVDLQNEFDQIDVLVVDEVSMVSPTLMAQIDASTRVAKNNDEPFGGLIVIFCGDFYQFPPVAALSLYDTIDDINSKKSTAEYRVQAKLGRIVWKTVNTVIELHRQERMKDDPAFGALVLRLRKGQCTQEDVNLLNTRVVRSHLNPDGVPLGPDSPLNNATVIVSSNEDRLLANYCKALVTDPNVVMCAARDFIDDQPVKCPLLRSYLLKLDMVKEIGRGALPAYVPLFRGMPVIMRRHNQAACLGIANGAQGILEDFDVDVDEHGYTYLKSSVVRFPDSRVSLSGLDPKQVALPPWRHSFVTPIPGALTGKTESTLTTVARYSTDWDPAFAITAHCAQGKTMDKVVGHISNGGPRAYVTVSRARRLKDLVLLSSVSVAGLNQSIKTNLLRETQRIDALHHNTLVRYGYKAGTIVPVPDPDADNGHTNETQVTYKWNVRDERESKTTGKRKVMTVDLPVESDFPPRKRRRSLFHTSTQSTSEIVDTAAPQWLQFTPHPLGCRWDENNWSCAYDCLTSMFCAILGDESENFRDRLRVMSPTMDALYQAFTSIKPTAQSQLEEVRHTIRLLVNRLDPCVFPLQGPALVPLERIFFTLTAQESRDIEYSAKTLCASCGSSAGCMTTHIRLLSIVSTQLLRNTVPTLITSVQKWIDLVINQEVLPLTTNMDRMLSCQCSTSFEVEMSLVTLPPLLYFEIHLTPVDLNEPASLRLTIATRTIFRLCGIIYSDNLHYTCRFLYQGRWWFYDGRQYGGMPVLSPVPTDLNTDPTGRCAHLVVYCMQ